MTVPPADVDAAVIAASNGRLTTGQQQALLAGIDRNRFITDGRVDSDKVTQLVGALTPASDATSAKRVGLDEAARRFGSTRTAPSTQPQRGRGLAEARRRFGNGDPP